jgi:ubiquinone/menaquinone biosynthesis C-methylase UbiE
VNRPGPDLEAPRLRSAAEVIAHFDRTALGYADAYTQKTNSGYSFRIRKQRVLELFDKPGGQVLDVGCGPGVLVSEVVTDYECRYHGVDIAPEMIRLAEARFNELRDVRFSVGTIDALAFGDSSFDAVLCVGVLEYLDDPAGAIEEMVRVLRPGGTLIVTLPNAQSPFRIWQRLVWRPLLRVISPFRHWIPFWDRIQSPVPHQEFRFVDHRSAYESAGCIVEDVVYYNFKVFPKPLDVLLRPLQLWVASALEQFGRSRVRHVGTGFIVKARKRPGP